MSSVELLQAATERHADQRHSILVTLIRALLGLWSGFDRVDDADVVAGMAAKSAQLVQSAVTRTRSLERSYLKRVFADFGISDRDLPPLVDAYPRANVGPSEVYRRPVEQWIWNRRNGGTLEESQAAFENRLRDLAEADIQTTSRDEAALLYESRSDVLGYRRIIHPELSRSGTCGLCIAASAKTYHSGVLMPLHGGTCNCTTLPIREGDDPGLRITQDDLKALYAAAGSTAAEDLQNVRVTVNDHGELGPMLVKKGDNFRTAAEAGRPAYVKPTAESIRAIAEREVEQTRSALASGQQRYDRLVTEHPESLTPNSMSPISAERIALFRSLKFLREYLVVAEARVKKLTQ